MILSVGLLTVTTNLEGVIKSIGINGLFISLGLCSISSIWYPVSGIHLPPSSYGNIPNSAYEVATLLIAQT